MFIIADKVYAFQVSNEKFMQRCHHKTHLKVLDGWPMMANAEIYESIQKIENMKHI